MTDLKPSTRDLALRALSMLSEMFSHSQLNKKLEGEDQRVFDGLVGVWTKGVELAGVTSCEQIDRGITAVMHEGSTFEPSIPAFMKMCKGSSKAYHKTYEALSRPRANKAIQAGQLAKMWEILGKQGAA
jgi:hypothetical protein